MKEIKPANNKTDTESYYLCEDEDGTLKCSCGRELIQMDEDTWKCTGGWPTYKFSDGSIFIDKFGRLMFKTSEH